MAILFEVEPLLLPGQHHGGCKEEHHHQCQLCQDQEAKMINIPAGSVDHSMVLDLLDHLVLYQCEHLVLHCDNTTGLSTLKLG